MITLAIIGIGFVGGAMYQSFTEKIKDLNLHTKYKVIQYDKFKLIGSLTDCLKADIIFTALPTQYSCTANTYDNTPTYEVVQELHDFNFKGLLVIKSTVLPEFTEELQGRYPDISFVHNPEFLTARTAYEDFHHQKNIVLGHSSSCNTDYLNALSTFYSNLYPNAVLNLCTSTESECVKLFCNTFYAVKIQYFNELYQTATALNVNYQKVVNIMLDNGWINPMHTSVPGPDGQLSYGGLCFTKDTLALLSHMKKTHNFYSVLEACVNERNRMRSDNSNIQTPICPEESARKFN